MPQQRQTSQTSGNNERAYTIIHHGERRNGVVLAGRLRPSPNVDTGGRSPLAVGAGVVVDGPGQLICATPANEHPGPL